MTESASMFLDMLRVAQAKATAVHGPRWDLVPGATMWVRMPKPLKLTTRPKVSRDYWGHKCAAPGDEDRAYHRREIRVPNLEFWPMGFYETGARVVGF